MFTDLAGDELCLRPDLTVPVSRLYLERHPDGKAEARYCYNGPAFRFQPQGGNQAHPREFRQAGIECFGVADRDSADVEIVLLAAEAVRAAGLKDFRLRFGDIALFYALLDALDLPERWRLKLRHYFWRPPVFHKLLARLANGERPDGNGPVAAFAGRLAGLAPDKAEETGRRLSRATKACRSPATARSARSPRGSSTTPPIGAPNRCPRRSRPSSIITSRLRVRRTRRSSASP